MLVYLDLCCFNRPWDDQSQDRIRLETEAKLLLQDRIRAGSAQLVWSYALDHECSFNPFPERRAAILRWRFLAHVNVTESPSLLEQARGLFAAGVPSFDSLHVACAQTANADMFVSTDDRLLRKLQQLAPMAALLPAMALARLEGWYEDRY